MGKYYNWDSHVNAGPFLYFCLFSKNRIVAIEYKNLTMYNIVEFLCRRLEHAGRYP